MPTSSVAQSAPGHCQSHPQNRPLPSLRAVPGPASVGRVVDHDLSVSGDVNAHRASASNQESRRAEAERDRELTIRVQSGDRDAFRELVRHHQRRAFGLALGLVRDEADAQEIVQEAFIRVYRGIGSFQHGSSFFTWLYRIVNNLAIDLMRRPSRRESHLDEGRCVSREDDIPLLGRIEGADPVQTIRRREIARRIASALDELPSYHRAVILMREVDGLSYQEMAEIMSVSKGTIMSRLFHARQKMQRALADCYAEQLGRHPTASGAAEES